MAQPVEGSEIWNGFRGLNWGDSANAIPSDVRLLHSDSQVEETAVYERTSDNLSMGGELLTSIQYHFWQDKLYRVSLTFRELLHNEGGVKDEMT